MGQHQALRELRFPAVLQALGLSGGAFKIRKGRTGVGRPVPVHNPKKNRSCFSYNQDGRFCRGRCDWRAGNEGQVAQAHSADPRGFLSSKRPEQFPPGTLVGPFRGICEQYVGNPDKILPQPKINELRDLVEYANRFHRDTNAAWET